MDYKSITAAGAALIPVITLLGRAAYVGWREWRKKRFLDDTQESRDLERINKRQEQLDRRSDEYLERLERDAERYERESAALRADRDYGWDLGRYWCGEAHRLRHDLVNCKFAHGDTSTVPQLPAFEDPLPRPEPKARKDA